VDHCILAEDGHHTAERQHFRIEFELGAEHAAGNFDFILHELQIAILALYCAEIKALEKAHK